MKCPSAVKLKLSAGTDLRIIAPLGRRKPVCEALENELATSFYIATFGCKVNQYDSQAVREELLAAGLEEAALSDGPDFVIVNTCTVTAAADGKARRFVRRVERELPTCRVIVTGCMVDRDAEQFENLPGVWRVLNNEQKPDIAGIIASETTDADAHVLRKADAVEGISGFAGRTRAFVKVQDGCDAWCTYCIVPSVRGKPRSRPMSEVLEEVRRLAGRFREIVLCGIHVGLYGDASGAGLAALIGELLATSPVERIRLSSIGPEEITPELIDLMAGSPRFCPHFHIALQSGSDSVLGRMGRRYTRGRFLAAIDAIRSKIDRASITTDVIVGFPGETAGDFQETVGVCRAAAFSRMHIFPFSARPGTPAAEMAGKCSAAIIAERKAVLGAVASELALAFKQSFVGETADVLVETSRDRSGKLCGYTGRYLRVLFDGGDSLKGEVVPVAIAAAEPDALFGQGWENA